MLNFLDCVLMMLELLFSSAPSLYQSKESGSEQYGINELIKGSTTSQSVAISTY